MITTLDDIQKEIALDFDSSPTAPASTDSEYSRRTGIINRFERIWGEKAFWKELEKNTTLNTVANTSTVDLPSDCENGRLALSMEGHIKIGSSWHLVIDQTEKGNYESTDRIAWITGNPATGYTLNIQPTPTEVLDIPLVYYSTSLATDTTGTTEKSVLVEASDITKCPNRYYLVNSVLAVLFKVDDEGNKGVDYERIAMDNGLGDILGKYNLGNLHQKSEIQVIADTSGYPQIGD